MTIDRCSEKLLDVIHVVEAKEADLPDLRPSPRTAKTRTNLDKIRFAAFPLAAIKHKRRCS
jgi:hypothetical protein